MNIPPAASWPGSPHAVSSVVAIPLFALKNAAHDNRVVPYRLSITQALILVAVSILAIVLARC